MKKNIFKYITTVMLALTLCTILSATTDSTATTPDTEIEILHDISLPNKPRV